MRIFISAGEPSGDLHGANLIRSLRIGLPDVEVYGFGGDKMRAAGCTLLYPLCKLAVMWFVRALCNIHQFLGLLSRADRWLALHRPDAVVLIDYPGFHWWLARRARARGIPVYYFVPPQLWAWAGWRIRKMRRLVNHVLCTLPFEQSWYQERGVSATYIGHPYFDELSTRKIDTKFVNKYQNQNGPVVAILPGSRNQEVHVNLSTMIRTAMRLQRSLPNIRFMVACFKEKQKKLIEEALAGRRLPIEVHVGRTPEIIHLADACVAVSGSVGLELLYHTKPSVIVYRVSRFGKEMSRKLLDTKFISLVNLLAGREIFPEYLSHRCQSRAIVNHLYDWLSDRETYDRKVKELEDLRDQTALPGACDRAAEYLLESISDRKALKIAA